MKFSTINRSLNWPLALSFSAFISLAPIQAQANGNSEVAGEGVAIVDVVNNYANIGLATYQDALQTAEDLRTTIEDLLNDPTEENLDLAQQAWRTARIPYEVGEIFVQGNPVVANWANQVNAWPIDASYIDYVAATSSSRSTNIIGSANLLVGDESIDVEKISTELISGQLHLANDVKTNVASGYHVIEFLLWGEDNSGAEETDVEGGAGIRPASDFDLENCTNSNCERRGEYLYTSVNLLIEDLQEMVGNWLVTGEARRALLADPEQGLSMMVASMSSLAYSELAANRLARSLNIGEQISEQDQFSNNSNISYLFNARGLIGVYFGEYFSMKNDYISGPSIADLMADKDPVLDEEFRVALGFAMARIRLMVEYARDVEAYDLMIAPTNEAGNALISDAIYSLLALNETLQKFPAVLGLEPIILQATSELENFQ